MFMNSLYRSASIYFCHHSFPLPLCSLSAKKMSSRGSSSGDRRFPTPKNHKTSHESFSLNDEDFPPLDGSKNKSGKSSGRSNADQSLTKKRGSIERYVPPGRRSDTSVTDQFMREKDAALSSSQSNVDYKIRDQSPIRRLDLDSETHAPVDRCNDGRSITDRFTERGANVSSFRTGSKHKVNNSQTRRIMVDRNGDFTNSFTLNKLSQSQDWRFCKNSSSPKLNHMDQSHNLVSANTSTPRKRWIIRKDGDTLKRNHSDSGFKNIDQSPKRQPFDICSPFRKRNDTSIKDLFKEEKEEEAGEKDTEQESVEVSSNKHKVLRPGMVLLKHYLTDEVQVEIVRTCRQLGLKPNGFYQPGYKDGAKLRLQMMCLGRNWEPQTKYSNNIIETDPIPETFSVLVQQAIREAQALTVLPLMSPDICIVNFYTETGRLGLHQDRDESRESIKKGLPIVSFSIGDSAEFLYGEERDVEKAEQVKLESGDVLIFGGEESRMIFHGVKYIIPNSAPMCLLNESKLRRGRLNLTFRQF